MKTPKGWRQGQTIFNFLEWLKVVKGFKNDNEVATRMADPFHLLDHEWEKYFKEFLKENK
jgi:hypothetical protein